MEEELKAKIDALEKENQRLKAKVNELVHEVLKEKAKGEAYFEVWERTLDKVR